MFFFIGWYPRPRHVFFLLKYFNVARGLAYMDLRVLTAEAAMATC